MKDGESYSMKSMREKGDPICMCLHVHPPLVSLKTSVFPPSHFIKHLINQTNSAHTGEIWGHMVHRELNLELPDDPMS